MRSLLLLMLILLAACSPEAMDARVAEATPPALQQQAKADLAAMNPGGKPFPTPIRQVGIHTMNTVGTGKSATLVFEGGPDADGKFTVARLQYVETDGKYRLADSQTAVHETSATAIPPFRLAEGSVLGYVFLALGVAAAVFSVAVAVIAGRTKGLRRKWLWVIGCLISFGNFLVGWTSGGAAYGVGVKVLGLGVVAMPGATEWIVSFGIPVIAILFLWMRSHGGLKIRPAEAG